jgi:Carboxypeptidase regulatory-like domain
MKRIFAIACGFVLLGAVASAQYTPGPRGGSTGPPPPDRQKGPVLRTLSGRVTGNEDAPLKDAIVYIKNTRTQALKTYIADDAGKYQFNALLPNVDYEVFAEAKGARSDTKRLSSFDSRKDVTINLKINQ